MDRYFFRNTAGISAVELLWGLGLPVVIDSTFLQLFLKHLGASSFMIGMVPTLFFIGISIFSFFSGFFTAHLKQKRTAVIILHVFAAVPILIFGIILNISGFTDSTLRSFFILYAFFSIGIGLILPTWQNFLVRIFSEKKILAGHSVMWISQSIGKFLGGFVILRIVTKYSFSSKGSGIIFTMVGILFLAGSFMFLLTRESSGEEEDTKHYRFTEDLKEALRNRNFLILLASDLELFSLIAILSFYANYAADYCAIEPRIAAGGFVILSYLGMISVNLLYGRLTVLNLKSKFMTGKIVSLLTALLLFFFSGSWAFFTVSFFIGVSRGSRSLVYMPTVKKISGEGDSTSFFGIAPLLTMPLSTGIPLLSGAFLDRFSYLGAGSYRYLFLGLAGLIIAGIWLLKKVDIPN